MKATITSCITKTSIVLICFISQLQLPYIDLCIQKSLGADAIVMLLWTYAFRVSLGAGNIVGLCVRVEEVLDDLIFMRLLNGQ